MLLVTLVWASQYDLGIRDPDGIIGWRFTFVLMLVGGFVALDVIPRAFVAARTNRTPTWATLVALARERWPWRRIGFVVGAIVAFYVTYLCYRNVKSYLPLARPEIVDSDLANFERGVFGTDPSTLLHQLLGTGVSAQVLSTVYLLFLTFVPISVGVALVWSTDRAGGLWWVSVLSINWVLGVMSYFVLPSMGPAFYEPHLFAGLPDTGTASLQAGADGGPAGVRRRPGRQRPAPEHRRLRVAARLDRVRRRRWSRTCCAPRGRCGSAMWVYLGADVRRDDLLRLALRRRRPRRLRDRLRVGLPRRRAHRLADRAQGRRRPACGSRAPDGWPSRSRVVEDPCR